MLIRLTIAEFHIERTLRHGLRRQVDRDDQLAMREWMLDMRRVTRQQVEVVDRDRSLAVHPNRPDDRVKRHECDRYVRRMERDAAVARSCSLSGSP